MVAKCANPHCQVPFRYFRNGRLFKIELCDKFSGDREEQSRFRCRRAEFFWLCEGCSSNVTLVIHKAAVVVVPISECNRNRLIELASQPPIKRIREDIHHIVEEGHQGPSHNYSHYAKEKLSMKRPKPLLAMWAVSAILLSTPALVSANTNSNVPDPTAVSQVANHLSTLKQQAVEVSRNAETLYSLARNHRTHWESHTYYLNTLREQVNSMGRMLAELEEMKPQASELQQMAIEKARPHLVAVAEDTTKALDLVRAGRHNLRQPEYKTSVDGIYEHAEGVYATVDTIIDYKTAKIRLQNLEPAPHQVVGE